MPIYSDVTTAGGTLIYDFRADTSARWQNAAKTTVANDGDPVHVWVPTGSGSSTTDCTVIGGTSTRRPIYRANYNATGKPALEYDGTDDGLIHAATNFPANGTATWCLIAGHFRNKAASGNSCFFGYSGWHVVQFYNANATLIMQLNNGGGTGSVFSTVNLDTYAVAYFLSNPGASIPGCFGVTNQCAAECRVPTQSGTPSGSVGVGLNPGGGGVNAMYGALHAYMLGTGITNVTQLRRLAHLLAADLGFTNETQASGGLILPRAQNGGYSA